MKKFTSVFLEQIVFFTALSLKWLFCLAAIAVLIGSASALFLWGLDAATRQRFAVPWLVYLLPLAGVAMGFYYRHLGKHVSSGNHIILRNLHKEGRDVPFALAPSMLAADFVCLSWGIHHTAYPAIQLRHSSAGWFFIAAKLALLAVVVAIICRLFVSASHFTSRKFQLWFPHEAVRASVGGMIVIALFLMVGTTDLFAGVAMIALFAAATKTPIASIVMGMELLGWEISRMGYHRCALDHTKNGFNS